MKTILLSIICLSLTVCGIMSVKRLKEREKNIYELSRLLKYMARSIKDTRRELTDIYIAFESPRLDKIGFSASLGESGFFAAVQKIDIPKESRDILCEFAQTLGKTFAGDQISSCIAVSEELDRQCLKMKREFPEKRNIYIGLSVLLAMALFIICI